LQTHSFPYTTLFRSGTAPVKRRQIRAVLGSTPCANGAAPGQPCGDGNRVDGDGCSSQCVVEGCASGNRAGLKDYQTYPHVAACGTPTDYLTAVAQAASTCQAGWHMCTLYSNDLDSIAASPKPAEPFSAWVRYDDVDCTFHDVFGASGCAGAPVMGSRFVHQAQYTHGCNGLGFCPEGYAPALYQSTWNYSARRRGSAVCAEHVVNRCGYAGGTDALVPSYTACCRD
jgi:cysteine-rich repeat protein